MEWNPPSTPSFPLTELPSSSSSSSQTSDPRSLHSIITDLVSENEFGALNNPLIGIPLPKLRSLGKAFASEYNLLRPDLPEEVLRATTQLFANAAILAQEPGAWKDPGSGLVLSESDRQILRNEKEKRWTQPRRLYSLIGVCATAAAVQGWNQTSTNGANTFYNEAFGIEDRRELWGLVDGAPYLCCAFACLL